jgi:DNA-3-methyladenine glycosylase
MSPGNILPRKFYLRPTLAVARELIGKYLTYVDSGNILALRLVEVEAYIGETDPACHAAVGKTGRNEIMYGRGGYSYIYFVYGMYHCLNVVTEKEGFPAAVLLRGAEPVDGVEIMRLRYDNKKANKMTDGPGKICKALNLSREHNGLDLVSSALYLEDRGYCPGKIMASPRIGINKAVRRKWRFYEAGSPYVSRI